MGKLKIKTKMVILLLIFLFYAVSVNIMNKQALDQMATCGSQEEAIAMSTQMNLIMTAVSGIIFVIFTLWGILITFDIVRSLDVSAAFGLRLAKGDLSAKVSDKYTQRKDSIGDLARSFEQIHENMAMLIGSIKVEVKALEGVVEEAKGNVDNISDEIENVSASTQQIAAGMQQTAASSEEVNATSEEIETVARNIATHAQNGAERVVEIHDRANQTKVKCEANRKHTGDIHREIKDSLTKALEAAEVVSQIEVLAQSIMDITSQTNLLSLNASIEAARAGEAGRGFAVVADEIRALADQSQEAVAHIQEVTEKVTDAVKNLSGDSRKLLEFVGTDVVGSFDFFDEMADLYNKDAEYVDQLVTDFSATSEELLASIDGVVDAISGVSTAATEGAQGTTQIADIIIKIENEADNIVTVVNRAEESSVKLFDDVSVFKTDIA